MREWLALATCLWQKGFQYKDNGAFFLRGKENVANSFYFSYVMAFNLKFWSFFVNLKRKKLMAHNYPLAGFPFTAPGEALERR